MNNENQKPILSLQTMVMAIQALEKEIKKTESLFNQSKIDPKKFPWTADDDIWRYDLDRAAQNLEEVYTHTIESNQVSNFPTYEQLVNRKGR